MVFCQVWGVLFGIGVWKSICAWMFFFFFFSEGCVVGIGFAVTVFVCLSFWWGEFQAR